MNALLIRWNQLAARERALLVLAASLVLVTVLWMAVIAPAVRTLRTSAAQAQALDRQLQRMQALQTQALAMQKQAPMTYDEAVRALNLATRQLLGNTAQVSVSGDRANVMLQGSDADALAQWLEAARLNARSSPIEARLTRIATPAGVTWSGNLAMGLPQR